VPEQEAPGPDPLEDSIMSYFVMYMRAYWGMRAYWARTMTGEPDSPSPVEVSAAGTACLFSFDDEPYCETGHPLPP
jgi:hypothetical protein